MTNNTKLVQIGDSGISIEVMRLTYGQRIERNALIRKFMPNKPDAAAEDREMDAARWNLIVASTQSKAQGIDFEPVHVSDSAEEFERKLAKFLAVDEEVIGVWLKAVDDISTPLVPRSQLPKEMLSEAESKDPLSAASGTPPNIESGKSLKRGQRQN